MNPIVLLLHLGGLIKLATDIEKGIADAVAKNPVQPDITAVLADLAALVTSGVFTIPGVTQAQIVSALGEIQQLGSPKATA